MHVELADQKEDHHLRLRLSGCFRGSDVAQFKHAHLHVPGASV